MWAESHSRYKNRFRTMLINLAPQVGFERTTLRLTADFGGVARRRGRLNIDRTCLYSTGRDSGRLYAELLVSTFLAQ